MFKKLYKDVTHRMPFHEYLPSFTDTKPPPNKHRDISPMPLPSFTNKPTLRREKLQEEDIDDMKVVYSSLCLLTYTTNINPKLTYNGYRLVENLGNTPVSKVFVNEQKKEYILVFRGTASLSDLAYDIQSVLSMDFLRTGEAIKLTKHVMEAIPDGYTCMLSGHSIGAHSGLFASWKLGVKCVAFSPFVTNNPLTSFRYTKDMIIFANRLDPVPLGTLLGDYSLNLKGAGNAHWYLRTHYEQIRGVGSEVINHSLYQWGGSVIPDKSSDNDKPRRDNTTEIDHFVENEDSLDHFVDDKEDIDSFL